ncbi:MAG: hypothetical protein AB199_00425 [Parcubacteria bacterium C7867-004]|nr:MAG: hypothetical protein AB199_00425 [Parcubacteria bacterium C7867-004]
MRPLFGLILALALFSGMAPGAARAQLDIGGAAPLTVTLNPYYPRPYQVVQIYPQSTLIDLSASTVTITVNGTKVFEGSGTAGAEFQMGASGEKTTVVTSVKDPTGQTYSITRVIRPAEVSLVVEPVSTVHPFYKGMPQVASQGRVRLVALADLRTSPGARLPNSSLVYNWRLGDQLLTDVSGIGKSTITADAPVRYRNAPITVTVTSPDSTLVGEASTTVSPTDPVVRIYRNDPLLGPDFDNVVSTSFSMPDTEATFRSVAYFFAVPPTLAWTVNGSTAGADKDITVRATGNGKGTAQLRLSASERSHFQNAETRTAVEFGATGGFLGIFGL